MNRRALASLGAGLLLLAAAAVAAAAAADARSWPGRLRVGDVRYRAAPAAATDPWDDGAGPVRGVLGVDDDLRFRRAVWAYRVAQRRVRESEEALGGTEARAQVESLLGGLAESDADPRRRSSAATMLGVLGYEEYARNSRGGGVFLQRSLRAFREAIQLDPTNDEAKFDLELLLELVASGPGEAGGSSGGKGGPDTDAGGPGTIRRGGGY